MNRRDFLQLVGVSSVLLASGGLVACSSPTPAGGPTAPAGTVSAKPSRGGTAVLAQVPDINTKNVIATQNSPNFSYGRLIWNTLTQYAPGTLNPTPQLATSWQFSDDRLTMTVKLRQDVKFHSGRAFGANDVVFALQNLQDPKTGSQLGFAARLISDMSASGSDTVTLKFSQPISNIFDLFEIMFIPDQETYPKLLTGEQMVGTGPFTFKSYSPGSSLVLARNPSYWVADAPSLDEVQVNIIPQAQALLASLQSGQTHVAFDLAPNDAATVTRSGNYQLVKCDSQDGAYYVGCNVNVSPLDNQQVRQAISYAIDRQQILTQVFAGIGEASSIPWAKTSPAYDADLVNHYAYDPAKAKSMLEAAGAAGAKLSLTVGNAVQAYAGIAQIVQYDLQQVGLAVDIVSVPAATFVSQLQAGTLPGLWVSAHGFNDLQPITLIGGAFPFAAQKNASNFVSTEYQQLANQAMTASPDAASGIYKNLNNLLLQEQFDIETVVGYHTYTVSSHLQGVSYNRYDSIDLDHAYLT
jgi:peptide/nickel transport system substrate-binding protein